MLRSAYMGNHNRERLAHPPLALAQQRNRRRLCRISGKMKSAETLQGDNLSRIQRRNRLPNWISEFEPPYLGVPQFELRSTIPASIRLRVEAAIKRIVILCLAGGTHFEFRHRSPWAIVRNVVNDGESWTAVCTIRERVSISPV